jgi:aryl-alcohol dehydrogenase-like predicted oxidoreductase
LVIRFPVLNASGSSIEVRQTGDDPGHCFQVVPPEAVLANQALVYRVATIAAARELTPAQIALARLLAQDPSVVLVPGARKLHRPEEDMASADIDLVPAELAELTEAADSIEIRGGRGTGHEYYVGVRRYPE